MQTIKYMAFIFLTCASSLCFGTEIPQKHYVGVFCATDEQTPDLYKKEAFELGQALAASNLGLVTGGANTGLMNAVMNGFTASGDAAHLFGIIPSIFREFNVHHPKIPESNLIWTDTIYQRFEAFHDKCDLMVVLPGGLGTLHELMDFMVQKQWGLHQKKVILLNTDHYWDYLIMQFKVMVEKNILKQKHLDHLVIVTSIEDCMEIIITEETTTSNEGLSDRYWLKESR